MTRQKQATLTAEGSTAEKAPINGYAMIIIKTHMPLSVKNRDAIGIGFLGTEKFSKAKRNEKKTEKNIYIITDTVNCARITKKTILRTISVKKEGSLYHGKNNIL